MKPAGGKDEKVKKQCDVRTQKISKWISLPFTFDTVKPLPLTLLSTFPLNRHKFFKERKNMRHYEEIYNLYYNP